MSNYKYIIVYVANADSSTYKPYNVFRGQQLLKLNKLLIIKVTNNKYGTHNVITYTQNYLFISPQVHSHSPLILRKY